MTKVATLKEVPQTTSIICDKCETEHDDPLEMQEFLSWRDTCGYGNNTFGDGSYISIDLCQYCVKEVLGNWINVCDLSNGTFGTKNLISSFDWWEKK